MTLKQFQKACIKSEPPYLTRGDEALLGLLGLESAAGTCTDIYKKSLYEAAELDKEGFVESLAYVSIYLGILAHAVDVELGDVLKKAVEIMQNEDAEEQKHAGDEKV